MLILVICDTSVFELPSQTEYQSRARGSLCVYLYICLGLLSFAWFCAHVDDFSFWRWVTVNSKLLVILSTMRHVKIQSLT